MYYCLRDLLSSSEPLNALLYIADDLINEEIYARRREGQFARHCFDAIFPSVSFTVFLIRDCLKLHDFLKDAHISGSSFSWYY